MQVLAGLGALVPWAFRARSIATAGLAVGIAIDVPFEFVMGTFSLSAGTYRFEALSSPTPGVCVLVARAETGEAYKLAVSTPSIRSHGGSRFKLVFHRRNERHFLQEVWLGGRCMSLELYRSLEDFDTDDNGPETEVILLLEPDDNGYSVYVIEDFSCTA
jgi:hypothetical protein